MSEIYAVQLTAVATLALAVLALATAVLAFMAWRKQSKEVRDQAEMLELQSKELRQVTADRNREAEERRRAQAVQVYMWRGPVLGELKGPFFAKVYLRNTSRQPVHYPRFGWDLSGDRATGVVLYSTSEPVLPGKTIEMALPLPSGAERGDVIQPVAIFRDHAGTWWCTWPDGRLEGSPASPSPQLGEERLPTPRPTSGTAPDADEQAP